MSTTTKPEDLLSEGLITIKEACDFLSVSRSSVWKLMTDGDLAYTHVGGSRRIPKVAVKRLAVKKLNL